MKTYRIWMSALALLLACGVVVAQAQQDEPAPGAIATIINAAGEEIGEVTFTQVDENVIQVEAIILDLEPGFHGFHIHGTAACDHHTDSPFTSAGGHMQVGDEPAQHAQHAGDMPSLLAMRDSSAAMNFLTDRFTLGDLLDDDGSAVIIHAGPDNYGNIPERYGTPDEATLNTGDAGSRAACGVIEAN